MKQGKWYLGFVEEITGVNTQGKTLAETRKNLREALILILETNRTISHRLHGRHAIEEPLDIAV